MDALEHAAVDELAQVAPDRLRGHAERVGEDGDLDLTVVAGPGQDLALPLVLLHDDHLPHDPRLVHRTAVREGPGDRG